jgi:hypothetical protein
MKPHRRTCKLFVCKSGDEWESAKQQQELVRRSSFERTAVRVRLRTQMLKLRIANG